MAIGIKKWNGSAWVNGAVKKYTGSSWVDAKVMKYNGSAWVQIYPETTTSASMNFTASNLRYVNGSGWSSGSARGGAYSSYGNYTGWLEITSSKLTGAGSVQSVTSVSSTYTREGIGSWGGTAYLYLSKTTLKSPSGSGSDAHNSKDQKMTWWSSTAMSSVGSSGGTVNGTVTYNDNSVGELKNWMNSKSYLVTGSKSSTSYFGLKAFTLKGNYTYGVTYVLVNEDDATKYSLNSKRSNTLDEQHEGLVGMYLTTEELENIGLENISAKSIAEYRAENGDPEIDTMKIISDHHEPFIDDSYYLHLDNEEPVIEVIAYNLREETNDTIEVDMNGEWQEAVKIKDNVYHLPIQCNIETHERDAIKPNVRIRRGSDKNVN